MAEQTPNKSNVLLYSIIGVGALAVVGGILYFTGVFKKKSATPNLPSGTPSGTPSATPSATPSTTAPATTTTTTTPTTSSSATTGNQKYDILYFAYQNINEDKVWIGLSNTPIGAIKKGDTIRVTGTLIYDKTYPVRDVYEVDGRIGSIAIDPLLLKNAVMEGTRPVERFSPPLAPKVQVI